jgi:hypothetical protein
MRAFVLSALFVLTAVMSGAAPSQEPPAEPRAGELQGDSTDLGPRGLDPEQRRRLEDVRRRQMAEFLDLDAGQAEALERELRGFRRQHEELRRERRRLMEELRRTLGAESAQLRDRLRDLRGDEKAALRDQLDALRRNAEARERALSEFRQRLSRDLTLEQQARLQLFAERFQKQLQEGARRIRERRGALGHEPGREPGRGFRGEPGRDRPREPGSEPRPDGARRGPR